MTADPLELLRASNPVPRGSSAPPIDRVLDRIRAERSARRPRRGWGGGGRWRGWDGGVSWGSRIFPAVGAATAIAAVAVVSVFLLAAHHRGAVKHSEPAKPTVSTTPSPVPVRPTEGMHGLVSVQGAGFASSLNGVISIQQCVGCRPNGDQTASSTDSYWLARTTDGGRTWSVTKRRYSLQAPLFVGQDGWAGGLQAQGSQAGGIAEYYVTHDGGRTWNVAPAAAPNEGGALVSVGGGEVWATGVTPASVTILHAPVTGSRLTATASQPIHGGWTNVEVFAGGPGTAYVSNADAPGQTFVTRDGGRSWQRIQQPCPRGERGGLTAAFGDTVWAECSSTRSQREVLARSGNGGASWRQLPLTAAPAMLQPVSADVAWAISGRTVSRTTDAGLTWKSVWAANSQPPLLRSQAPPPLVAGLNPLSAQSPTAASVVMTVVTDGGKRSRYTNLVVYRTSNGGATWIPSVVRLPAG
jgi:hypothetical protein